MDFKDNLKNLLSANNMSQSDLSKLTGIPSSLISNYVKGTKLPAMDNSKKIANAFGITLDQLSGRAPLEQDEPPSLEQLSNKYNLDAEELDLVKNYVSMTDEEKKAVTAFIQYLKSQRDQ